MQPIVKTELETIEEIHRTGSSISRFGDGEFHMMNTGDLKFAVKRMLGRPTGPWDNNDWSLRDRLREVVTVPVAKHLIAIPAIFSEEDRVLWRQEEYYRLEGENVRKWLKEGQTYYSAYFNRPFRLKSDYGRHWKALMRIWEGRSLALVHPRNFYCDYKLFRNTSKVSFVKCAFLNAWAEYDRILDDCRKSGCDVVLASAGAMATVLAYDLAKEGIQCLDFGNFKFFGDSFGLDTVEWEEQFVGKSAPARGHS